MTLVLIIVFAALLAALFLIRVSRGHAAAISRLEDLDGRTQPVDLEAFRNLVDPAERRFLQSHLTAREFRVVQRERTLAAAVYVRRIADNAAVLLRLGQAARANPNPEISRAAQQMVERALAVRMLAMSALIRLYLQSWLPRLGFSTVDVFDRYRRLIESAALFTRLQQPAYAARVSAML